MVFTVPHNKQILIIIESPGKVKSFKKYLPSGYEVVPSVGHIVDLPRKKIGVNVRKDFEPTWEVMPEKNDILKKIEVETKKSKLVIIMTDPDREGCGLGWNIYQLIKEKYNVPIKRAITHSITKPEILKAIQNAYAMEDDIDTVNSYECRRILDRIVGFKTSFLTFQASGGKSAGRVQSSCLRIIAEREKEIRAFIPQEYWNIDVELLTARPEKIFARIKKPKPLDIKTEAEAKKICADIKEGPVVVSKYDKKSVFMSAYPPFTTSTLLQSAATICGWKSDKTMRIAQTLYQTGAITYHRTDSVHIVPEFITLIRNHITSYGGKYLPAQPNTFASKKRSQEAHEACRVTDLATTRVSDADQNELYQLIWKRTVASQMSKLEQLSSSAEFSCKTHILSASGSKVIFDGWRKVWDYGTLSDSELPLLVVGEKVKAIQITPTQKFTEPPPRYTSNSIIKKLEDNGIGRPSTYSSTIKTLEDRKYIDHQKRNIAATDLGIRVTDFLVESNFCFIDIGFTADLEEKLDDIAGKKADKVTILTEFWDRLKKDIEEGKKIKDKFNVTSFKCPKCSDLLVKKHGKFGSFLACQKYTTKKDEGCDYTANIGEDGKPIEKKKATYKESKILCQNCKEPMVIRQNKRGGDYLGCRNFMKSDGCKGFFDTDGNKIEFKKKTKKKTW